jgi:succinate dehydrogenase (ubiquinone) cytochrome b560 subunit
MNKTGRPMSPHVTIYTFPVGALSSITNRVTGVALSLGAAGLGAIEILAGSGTSLELMQMIGAQGVLIPAAAKCKLSGPLQDGFVHICYGMLLTEAPLVFSSH